MTEQLQGQGVGQPVPRKEDQRHLLGKGRFVSDIFMPEMQEVAFLRSPQAHAKIVSIRKPDDFLNQVFIRSDLHGAKNIVADSSLPGFKSSVQPVLADQKVRFVGEPMAMAFAPSRALAEDILESVVFDLEPLDPVVNIDQSERVVAKIHDHWPDNEFLRLNLDKNFEQYRQKATVTVQREISLARQSMVPLEGKAVLAYWDHQADQLVIFSATQVPHMIRTAISDLLGLSQETVRVISPDVGGAFGYKCVLQPEEVCVAWLALTHKKPFRYLEDKREHLTAGANTRQHHYNMTLYADDEGTILAVDAVITIDGGAYSVWPFTIGLEPSQALGNLPGPYAFQGYRATTICRATNKPGFVPYRGVARTGVCFAMELMVDALARKVGQEPWQIRAKNLVAASQMPYVNVANKHFDSGDYPASLIRAREMIRFEHLRAQQRLLLESGGTKRIGIGFATYTEQSAHGTSVFASWGTPLIPGHDSATVRLTPDGGAEVRVGVHSHGQGMETSFAQIVHEILGISIERIRLIHGDTGQTPFSTGTYASRSLVMSGGAVSLACKALLPRLQKIAAHLLGVAVLQVVRQGQFFVVKGSSEETTRIVLSQICNAWYINPQKLPIDVDPGGLEVTMGFKPKVDTGCFSYASHAAVVQVDLDLGVVKLLDYAAVEDCGRMINPLIVEGQTIGGIAQGIGTALYEESPYDANGQPVASTLADYLLPGAAEVPTIRIEHIQTLSPHTEFGAKGMGEGGAIAPPAAIFNAVNDALADLNVEMLSTPLSPRKLLQALHHETSTF